MYKVPLLYIHAYTASNFLGLQNPSKKGATNFHMFITNPFITLRCPVTPPSPASSMLVVVTDKMVRDI